MVGPCEISPPTPLHKELFLKEGLQNEFLGLDIDFIFCLF